MFSSSTTLRVVGVEGALYPKGPESEKRQNSRSPNSDFSMYIAKKKMEAGVGPNSTPLHPYN